MTAPTTATGGVDVAALTEFVMADEHAAAASADSPAVWPIEYLLWSNKYSAWWRSGGWGYTTDKTEAGRFSKDDAIRYVVRSAHCGVLGHVTCMVAVPYHRVRS